MSYCGRALGTTADGPDAYCSLETGHGGEHDPDGSDLTVDVLRAGLTAAEAEARRLREALVPYVCAGPCHHEDCKQSRAALAVPETGEPKEAK